MQGCGFNVSKKGTILCGLAVQDGSAYCPRHTYLANIEAETARQKDAAKQNITDAGIKMHKLPSTKAQLRKDGYQFVNDSSCSGCGDKIEWWRTPLGKRAPFNPMVSESSFAKSHFATCKNAVGFRKAS